MPTIPILDTNANTEEKNNISKEVAISRKRASRPKKAIEEVDAKQKQDERLKAIRKRAKKRRQEEATEEQTKRLEENRVFHKKVFEEHVDFPDFPKRNQIDSIFFNLLTLNYIYGTS